MLIDSYDYLGLIELDMRDFKEAGARTRSPNAGKAVSHPHCQNAETQQVH